jgi:ABC-type Fe3+ transport system permease subunit
MKSKFILVKIILIILIISLPVFTLDSISQSKNTKNYEIKPSPKNIRESTALYVYLLWIWLVIFVLIYIFILKIKEVDRMYKMKFESYKNRDRLINTK